MAGTYLGKRVEVFQHLFHGSACHGCNSSRNSRQAGGGDMADCRVQGCADNGLF